MRKKKHFRINATDKQFDRFFVINYAKAPGEGGGGDRGFLPDSAE